MQERQNSVIKTLAYSDIFDYPLTFSEIFKYCTGKSPLSKDRLGGVLIEMVGSKQIGKSGRYYFLPGRLSLVKKREYRARESFKKLKIAKRAVQFLKIIPTIKLIGVSGSLASRNCERDDDIDLFIITLKNALWITRFLVNFLLILSGAKRSTTDFLAKDKICPNMFLSEDALALAPVRRNIFGAREVAQLLVLLDRDNTYQKFLFDNRWVENFLPNTTIPQKIVRSSYSENTMMRLIDRIFYAAQLFYMSGKITEEEVKPSVARFHPKDKMNAVLELYKERCKYYLSLRGGFDEAISNKKIAALPSVARNNN